VSKEDTVNSATWSEGIEVIEVGPGWIADRVANQSVIDVISRLVIIVETEVTRIHN
jgi:hypothetical protein